ncbi:hypothetical protein, partial [Salmonella enterica]
YKVFRFSQFGKTLHSLVMLLFYLNVSVHTASTFPAFLNIQLLTLYLPLLTIQKDSVTKKNRQ